MTDDTTDVRLVRSIITTIIFFFAAQGAIYAAFALSVSISSEYLIIFISTAIATHTAVLLFLISNRSAFVIEETGQVLSRVNAANVITLARISSLPTILTLVLASRSYDIQLPLLIFVGIAFATDFVDGWVSRSAHQITHMGKLIDSVSDYLVIGVLSICFCIFGLIPVWFVILLLVRGFFQGLAMLYIIVAKYRFEPKPSFLGKASVASTMILYGLELLEAFLTTLPPVIFIVCEFIVGGIIAASFVDKILIFAKTVKAGKTEALSSEKPN